MFYESNGLSIEISERRKWISSLVEADILNLKDNTNTVEYLVNKSNPRIQTVALSIISMIVASEQGAEYFTKPYDSLRKYVDMLVNVPEMSVAHRFGLAIIHKMSYYSPYPPTLLDCKIDNYIMQFMENYNAKKCHAYFAIFYTALAYNILTSPQTRDKISRFSNRYSPFCVALLEFFKKDLPSAAYQNILETFKYMLADKEIFFRDLMTDSRGLDTLRIYGSNLHSMFKGR